MILDSNSKVSLILTVFCLFQFQWTFAQGAISLSGWSDSPTQYHIQTDEGSERFFKYQTYNGQYRKERRMDDGTVIGSYGWVDPAGFLRMTDYVADNKGYRVVNSRMEYVGVKPDTTATAADSVGPNSVEKESYHHPTSKQGNRVLRHKLPNMFRREYSELSPVRISTTATTTTTSLPILETTKSVPVPESGEPNKKRKRVVKVLKRRPKIDVQNLNITSLDSDKRPFVVQVTKNTHTGKKDVFRAYATPIRRGSGFIYKIPTQYHKEEIEPRTGNQVGSFGYVDPFGIRRVIHYNAGQNGFQHEVDFKYVGTDSK